MKIKTPETTHSAVLAMVLDDMEFLGLIRWKPDADKKPDIDRKPQAQDQHAISKKAAAWLLQSAIRAHHLESGGGCRPESVSLLSAKAVPCAPRAISSGPVHAARCPEERPCCGSYRA